jgi:hypothetical protein
VVLQSRQRPLLVVEAVTEVADTAAAVTLVEVTSAEVGPMCTLEGTILASPEVATSGITATVGLAGIGVMADLMAPATRTAGLIRTATGRNELKPMGVLSVHLAAHESSRLVTSFPSR